MSESRTERRIVVGGIMAGPEAPRELPRIMVKQAPLPFRRRLVALVRRMMP